MSKQQEFNLAYLNDTERLKAAQAIIDGCSHLWSKGKLQQNRLTPVLENLMHLAENDPYFLAHFTSYAVTKLDSKDLKVAAVFANSLNDADGTPFSPGSDYTKPNLRLVSQAAIQHRSFDPKLVERLVEIANLKQLLIFLFLPGLALADVTTQGKQLADFYLKAFKAQKSQGLRTKLPTKEVMRALMKGAPESKVEETHQKMHSRFIEVFNGVMANARKNKIDMKKLKIKLIKPEVVKGAPHLVYIKIPGDYAGREINLSVVALNHNNKLYLMEIDNKSGVFNLMIDSE